jgi:hypothetical protein
VVDTVELALRMVESFDSIQTIEIHQQGEMQIEPLTLDNRRLTIQAGSGFTPTITFRPRAEEFGMRHSMIQLVGGELHLQGLHIMLEVPRAGVERWSLMELQKVDILDLQDTAITIKNSLGGRSRYIEDVAVVELRVPPGSDMPDGSQPGNVGSITEINLRNCLVRGEATLLRADESVPVQLKWVNGLLITTERMVNVQGAQHAARNGEYIHLDL